jgi:hypothetical protein
VGWVKVTAGRREVKLKGVRGPKAFADLIGAAARGVKSEPME